MRIEEGGPPGAPRLPRIAGVLVTAVGLVALVGWQLDLPLLLQGRAGLPAISPQTALAFTLLGPALLLARRLGNVPSLVLGLMGAAVGLHGVFSLIAGQELAGAAPLGFAPARQMSFASALAVSLSGAAIVASILWRKRPIFDYVASLTGSAVMLLGSLGLVAQIALTRIGNDATLAWMSVPAALGCLFLGLGLLGLPRLLSGRRVDHLQRSVAIVVTLAVALGTVFLWQALERQERAGFETLVQDHADFVASDVRSDLRDRKATLVRLARRLEIQPGPSRGTFEFEAELLMRDLPALDAVSWHPPAGDGWLVTRPGSGLPPLDDALPPAEREALGAIGTAGEELTTRRLSAEGYEGLAVAVPMAGEAGGYLIGVFRTPALFDEVVSSAVLAQFAVSIHDETGVLYGGGVRRSESQPRVHREAPVALRGVDWWVQVSPDIDLWEASDTALPETVLGGGLMMAVLLGLAVHLFGLARRRAQMAEQANAELASEIEERQRVEQSLRRREIDLERLAQRLEQSNQHLDRFASVVAHDLKEPLVTVGMFAEEVDRELGDGADPQVRDFLQRIQRATARMRHLIESILALSRITSRGEPFAPVDLSTVLNTISGDLRGRLEATGGCIDVGVLPVVDGDAHQLQQLFQNLVANALKFGREGVPPEVSVRWLPFDERSPEARDGGRSCRIAVSDNGIGFSEASAARLFDEFERLPEAEPFEGHGLGLAICRRIVERHGGTIHARPNDGEGAVIEVDLPLCHAEPRPEPSGEMERAAPTRAEGRDSPSPTAVPTH
jgi:signal transduction histidine kinase